MSSSDVEGESKEVAKNEFKRLKAAKDAIGNVLREYELLAGKRKIPLLKSLIKDVREIYDGGTSRTSNLWNQAVEFEQEVSFLPMTTNYLSGTGCEEDVDIKYAVPIPPENHVSSGEQAMKIDIVISEIFRNLNAKSLKSMRLVCLKYRNLATTELHRRDLCQISLYMSDSDRTTYSFRVGSPYSGPGHLLENLSESLQTDGKFICSDFQLCHPLSELASNHLIPFFEEHGVRVKSLRLSHVSSAVALGRILRSTPNLERLDIETISVDCTPEEQEFFNCFPNVATNKLELPSSQSLESLPGEQETVVVISLYPPNSSAESPSTTEQESLDSYPVSPPPPVPVILDKLKYLKISSSCLKRTDDIRIMERNKEFSRKIFQALLLASPNLTRIENLFHQFIRIARKAEKTNAIKGIEFIPSTINSKLYKNFALKNPKLNELTVITTKIFSFNERYISVGKTLTRFLQTSSDSLQRLIMQPIGFLGNVRFPRMESLEYLALNKNPIIEDNFANEDNSSNQRFFARKGQFTSWYFPNLKTVRFGVKLTGKVIGSYLPSENPDSELLETVPSVQNVEVANKLDVFGLRLITAKFPNIIKLKLEHTQYSGRIDCHAIWEFLPENLEHLELCEDSLNSFDYDRHNRRIPFDSIFTGIPDNVCAALRQRPDLIDISNFALRKKSSICDLRNLKTLRFVFANGTSYKDYPWFSQVTGHFAFQLMPQLKVTIAYDKYHPMAAQLAKSLEPIFPYVSFEQQRLSGPYFHAY